MAVPSSRQGAKELVQQIAKDHGYLGEEYYQTMTPETRLAVEEAMMKKDEMIGSSVMTLARNLYSSKARFVFELLQNADDNSFGRAAALGEIPYISFRVFPHRIVVECNEDGFTYENLKAICAVGKSSKIGSEGYIGEKGIGFKSVFMVAWKAHIQSGVFSFSFSHQKSQSGMGMISPVWEDSFEDMGSPMTRLTLHLQSSGETDAPQDNHRSIQDEFHELQETFLLFMKKLGIIRISFHDADEQETSSLEYSIQRQGIYLAVLRRTMVNNNIRRTHVRRFHVTSYEATNVPRHENRVYSNRALTNSSVVLAFPISGTSAPIIEPQDVFAYLPVRPIGFKFIIQADFVTDASRQDIVRDSRRNIALLDGIAGAFAGAVLQFCEHGHDSLRLQWMRYLPDRKDENWGSLWLSLVDKIADRLSKTRVLYCHKKFDRHLIGDLVRLTSDVYADGEPLFEDGDPEEIVSQKYSSADLIILMDYGLKCATFGHINKWVATDLTRGTRSRMRSTTTAASWHTQASKLLHMPFSNNWSHHIQEIKEMALLPLKGGTWVSLMTGPVFFGRVNGIDIPPDIGLRIIDESITNTHRRVLFQDLGVKKAPVFLVRRRILEMYQQPGLLPDLSVQTSKQHLTFLYLTHHLKPADENSYPDIVLLNQDEYKRRPIETCLYTASDKSPYSPWELLKGGGPPSGPGSDAPGYMAGFVNEGYFLHPPQTPPNQALTWVRWFYDHLQVGEYVYLGYTHLTEEAKYLQNHRPDRFVGALRMHHHRRRALSSEFIAHLQETEVLCRGGRKVPLKNTYFPTKSLEALVNRFMEQEAFFPWLWVDPQIPNDTTLASWDSFLNKFSGGVVHPDGLEFALDMLQYSVRALTGVGPPGSEDKLCSLYIYIHSQFLARRREARSRTRIREVFANIEAIYVPLADSHVWASPKDCVWGAAQELRTMYVLEILYKPLLSTNPDSRKDLEPFFCDTLGISDCTMETYIEELKVLKVSGAEDSDMINVLYEEIDRLWRTGITQQLSKDQLRSEFEDHALIYVPSDEGSSWRKTSQCVWSAAARLRDMVSLNNEYEDLEHFFVDIVGVRPVTLSMAIDELKEAGNRQSISVEEVRASLLTVNSLLCSGSDPWSPELMESKIFPVRYPKAGVQCVSAQTQFCIVDRESLRSSFEDHVKLFDFSLEEVVQLRPFLSWVRLEDRYISRCVREFTSVQESGAHPISKHGHEFRHRAHALLRIAKHFESPRATSARDTSDLYELLRNAKIFAANTISLELSLSQDGVSYRALGGSMNMHLHEQDSDLMVYLPHRKTPQQHAFNKHLPERLLQWLMTEEDSQIRHEITDKAIIAMKDVWNAPLATLSTTLDECGIITIDTPNSDPVIDEDSSDSESGSVSERAAGGWSGSQTTTQSDDGNLAAHSEVVDTPSVPDTSNNGITGTHSGGIFGDSSTTLVTQGEAIPIPLRLAAPNRDATPVEPFLTTNDQPYIEVLEDVIVSAAASTIPDRNEGSHPQRTPFIAAWRGSSRVSGATQFERDCKIGAAGELFVFELLSRLDPVLPHFSRANWQSTMRRYVKVHPTYANMSRWTGIETSDIIYSDVEGVLTDALIRNHHLDSDRWAGATPQYFIEVKTTVSACGTPFFMSNAQYERMQNATLSAGNTSVIYVIFRVYQLDQGNQGPGLKVYVDPEALRLSGELNFTAQTWSVVPGANAL